MSASKYRGAISQTDYVRRMHEIQSRAVGTTDMGIKTASFWLMENLSSTFLKQAQPGQSLRDPSLKLEIRPISHCGMGIAAVELANFSPDRLRGIIEPFSNPDYHLFAYEGAGAMLALYEPDMFRMMTMMWSKLGLLPLSPLRYPEPRGFVASFDPEIRRLLAHGYGRMLYFKNHGIPSAVKAAQRTAYLEAGQCIQGIAFAYSMVNNGDLGNVFRAGQRLQKEEIGPAFTDGLVYALEFWEWMAPGFLSRVIPSNVYESTLINTARAGVEAGRERGSLAPFAVEPYRPRV